MNLRPYQQDAVDAINEYLATHETRNPVAVIPTGGGKTPVMAAMCRQWNDMGARVVVLAHVKELLEQTAGTLQRMVPDMPVGVYSAGLGRRDVGYNLTVAGVQSIWRRGGEIGPVDLLIVDEAHCIPHGEKGDGMYLSFISDAKLVNPHLRVIGLTATPYRLKSGMIVGENSIFQDICYEVGVLELMEAGFLCPLKSKGSAKATIDTSKVSVVGGEYVAAELSRVADDDALVRAAVDELLTVGHDRKSVLIFACGLEHAAHIQRVLIEKGQTCDMVDGTTPDLQRAAAIARFREGRTRFMVNVMVLTTGFDAPNVDCVAMMRPTKSPGLYYQMVGRGFRICEGKEYCLVLDFSGNVMEHGPVNLLNDSESKRRRGLGAGGGKAPCKTCPECQTIVHAAVRECPECGTPFPDNSTYGHEGQANDLPVVAVPHSNSHEPVVYDVIDVGYYVHAKKGDPNAPTTLKVEYMTGSGFKDRSCEWVCFNHGGWAREKAEAWWKARSNVPVPATVELACELAKAGALMTPTRIQVTPDKANPKWSSVTRYWFAGEKPGMTPVLERVIKAWGSSGSAAKPEADADDELLPEWERSTAKATPKPAAAPMGGEEALMCNEWVASNADDIPF